MRLNPKEVNAIVQAFADCLSPITYKLYLFGSRADDNKKGGDIDLLVVVANEFKSDVAQKKTTIRSRIFDSIDEQKIDITVATEDETLKDPFLSTIFPTAILMPSGNE
ncbi:MAG: nucleotidyltransferase domain-containing protein [Bdellovibrio sp.]|nr:nucleotidyltransferase domain-containing protein [Bdellovibrio sp.]